MYFGLFPPEINSGRMYAGPGSGPMLTAAAAWDDLAAQLQTTAASYSSVISGLTTTWRGPSSVAMAAAAAPYVAWMSATAAQAEQTAMQARTAAAAYETAFAATVPPPVIAANRSQLASLVATNLFGQNTPAIAANEAQYSQMWAQDAGAMNNYAGQSAAAATVTPFAAPAATTNPGGLLGQLATIANTYITQVVSTTQAQISNFFAAIPTALQSFSTIATGPNPLSGLLTAAQDFAGMQSINSLTGDLETIPKVILPANDVMITTIMSLVFGTKYLNGLASAGAGAAAAGGGAASHLVGSAGLGEGGSAVSADVGGAGLVGGMSVPPSWATATPAIRTVASVLSHAGQDAIPAGAVSDGTLLSGMAVAAMAGSALGAAAPSALRGAGAKLTSSSLKNSSAKDGESPETLQRLVAEMAEKPDNVQHWHTDLGQLESLFAKLKTKPGIHAVHLSDDDFNKIAQSQSLG
ncbi:PPE family protein [Mycobacterium interjectum]|uniref:PPE family protein n=1 Tax=Mycobacterium interjectum TaxID=33895 RepID=UPI0008346E7B|nr:PPE family protein [Mycobacterium interjectum]MCV7089058.1 PPE family protein [Mycobacterium interjectum]